jgi:hypothetical protein
MDRQLHLQTARSMPPCGSGRRARAGQCRGSSALPAPTSSGMPRPRPAGAPVSSPTCATTLAAGEGVCAGHQPPLGRARSGVPRLGTKRPGVWPWDGAAGHGGRAAACCQHGGAARLCEPGQSGGDPLWRAQSVPVQVVDRIRSAPKICTVLIKSGIGSRGGRNVRAPCDPESGCPVPGPRVRPESRAGPASDLGLANDGPTPPGRVPCKQAHRAGPRYRPRTRRPVSGPRHCMERDSGSTDRDVARAAFIREASPARAAASTRPAGNRGARAAARR